MLKKQLEEREKQLAAEHEDTAVAKNRQRELTKVCGEREEEREGEERKSDARNTRVHVITRFLPPFFQKVTVEHCRVGK